MSLLKIRYYPDPILKVKATDVTEFGPQMQKFFDDLIETMYVEDGVGLAAPQVGVSKRVLIACPTMKRGQEFVIVNPVISNPKGKIAAVEGCLSFPGISGEIERAKEIHVSFQDRYGKQHEMDMKDFFARIVQHENDHLDGILFIDRVNFSKRQKMLSEYQTH